MIRSLSAFCWALIVSATAFVPQQQHSAKTVTTTQQNAVEEVASAIQQSSDMLHHGVVVGPFSDILQGHHPAQFDDDGGIMMTEHLDDPILKPVKGSFVPPTPMRDAASARAAAALVVPTAAILQEKSHGRPVPVYYMD